MKHRTAIVTALSIAGVLIAGVSAIGANFGILASAESDGIGSATPTTVASATSPAVAFVDTTATTSNGSEVFAYEVEGVGVVMLQHGDDGIEVAGVDAPGWAWELTGDGTHVVVSFVQGASEFVFDARLVGDEIQVSVEDRTPSYSDDDHDDDHDESGNDDHEDEDDDHDEEHEDDD